MNTLKQRILVFLFPLLLSLPFLNRAYFVDDNYFVEIASWLADHPGEPYHFRTDDAGLQNRGWEEDGFVRMVNPLLHHYYLSFLIKMGGNREWFLRLGCVLLSCFTGLFLLGFTRRFTEYPLLTTLLILATPVHWLTSHSLLIDSTMGFLFMGALYYFMRGAELDSIPHLVKSGIFMGLAILTKYTALLILPLTGLWIFLRWKKIGRKFIFLIPWAIGLLFLGWYSWWTAQNYGAPHILAASQRMVKVFGWGKYIVFFVFLSGSTLIPLFVWGLIPRRMVIFNGAFILLLGIFLSSDVGGFTLLQGNLISLWFITSILFATFFWQLRDRWVYPRDPFLYGWFLGFIAMMFIVMGWVAVRYYVLVVPAIIMLSVRMVEIRFPSRAKEVFKGALIVLMVFTSALAYADYKQAEPSRLLVQDLQENGFEGGRRHFYLGDSFTMSYLREEGWIPCFPETEFQVGDQVLAKEVTMPLIWFGKKPLILKSLATFNYPTHFPLKVMDYHGSAGFYASVWGALPFTFSTGPWERFHLFEVTGIRKTTDN